MEMWVSRVVRTLDTADGFTTMGPSGQVTSRTNIPAQHYAFFPGFSTPLSAKNDYTDVLPSLNLRLHWAEHLQSRLAVSEGMARPDFSQLQAFNTLSSNIRHQNPGPHDGTDFHRTARTATRQAEADEGISARWNARMVLRAKRLADCGDLFYKHLTDIVVNRVFTPSVTDSAGVSHASLRPDRSMARAAI